MNYFVFYLLNHKTFSFIKISNMINVVLTNGGALKNLIVRLQNIINLDSIYEAQ